jgi:hypothetical protein
LPGGDVLARPHVLFQALYIDSASLFRRDLTCEHGVRYPSGPVWEDWVFQALALRVGEIHVLPDTLLDYGRHAAQQTSPARLMASGRRTLATCCACWKSRGDVQRHGTRAAHAISPSPFGLVPDRDFLLRHRDTLEAEAEAWLGRLGRQAVLAGWTSEAAFAEVAAQILRRLSPMLGAAQAGLALRARTPGFRGWRRCRPLAQRSSSGPDGERAGYADRPYQLAVRFDDHAAAQHHYAG